MNEESAENSYHILLSKIINDYAKDDLSRDPSEFIKHLYAIINNPLSLNENLIKLVKLIKKKQNNSNSSLNWQNCKDFIRDYFLKNIKVKNPFFEGKLRQIEKKFLNVIVKYAEYKGVSKTIAIINIYLLIHKNLTQSQLKELTDLSKGAISENLNQLTKVGFVKKRLIRGTRTYIYSLGGNMAEITSNVSMIKREIGIDIENYITKKIQILKENNESTLFLERLNDLKDYLKVYREITENIILKGPIKKILEN